MATFPATNRLHHKNQFDAVYRRGRRVGDVYFLLLAQGNRETRPRLGLSVSAKAVGKAVNRNRIKRIIRESFRQQQHTLPPIDIVVNAKSTARDAPNDVLRGSLEKLWLGIAKQCAH